MGSFLSCNIASADYEDYETFNETDCNCSVPSMKWNVKCNCDYEDAPPPTVEEVLPLGLVYGIVFLIGTIGNGLVIFVVNRYKKMRNVTNMFLASLSTADLCLIWFCVPIQYMKYLSYSWEMGGFLCISVHYVQQVTRCCSVLTLTTISFERYLAIAYPMKTLWLCSIGRTKKVILILWISAIIIAAPAGFRMEYLTITTRQNRTAIWCLRGFPMSYPNHDILEKVYCLCQFLLMLVVPLITMSFCYLRIICIVYRKKDDILKDSRSKLTETASCSPMSTDKLGNKSARNTKLKDKAAVVRRVSRIPEQNRKQIVHMLVAIVLLYTLCWTPSLLDDLLVSFGASCQLAVGPLKHIRMVSAVMAYANSCINPIVYGFMSRHFRTTFLEACGCVARRSRGGQPSAMHRRQSDSLQMQSNVVTTSPAEPRYRKKSADTPKSRRAPRYHELTGKKLSRSSLADSIAL